MTSAIIYARFSPRPDSATSDAAEKQVEHCREYCHKKGYTVEFVCVDRGISGDAPIHDRPGLLEALFLIKRGWIFVCLDESRLARNVSVSETLYFELANRHARPEFVFGSCSVGDCDPVGELVRVILSGVAQMQRKIGAMKTSVVMKRHQRNGRQMGGKAPFGWRITSDKRLDPVPEEQTTIERVISMRAAGRSMNAIAKAMQASGIRHRGSKKWTVNHVRRIIKRREETEAAS